VLWLIQTDGGKTRVHRLPALGPVAGESVALPRDCAMARSEVGPNSPVFPIEAGNLVNFPNGALIFAENGDVNPPLPENSRSVRVPVERDHGFRWKHTL
jgi:hypothetical protein